MLSLIRRNGFFFLPYLLVLLAGAVLQWQYSQAEIFLYINARYSATTDFLFQYLTHLGDGLFYVAVILLLLFVRYRYALIALLSFGISSGVAQLLKRLFFAGELRPKAFFEQGGQLLRQELHWVEGLQIHSHNSFPSGHTTTAFSVFCLLALLDRRKSRGLFWLGLALLAAYSRVYLGQHFFGDVYAGSLIGTATTLLVYSAVNGYFNARAFHWPDRNLRQRTRQLQ